MDADFNFPLLFLRLGKLYSPEKYVHGFASITGHNGKIFPLKQILCFIRKENVFNLTNRVGSLDKLHAADFAIDKEGNVIKDRTGKLIGKRVEIKPQTFLEKVLYG